MNISNGQKPYENNTGHEIARQLGIPQERVHHSILEAVQKLFPSPMNGIEFLGLVLRYANVKQLSLPNFAQGEKKNVAVITVKNIRALSKLIGWSYDTTNKYVVLFCALGIFIKGRRQRQVELYFPLDSYNPPESLSALDLLIAEYRPKVRQSAQQVKSRFLLHFRQPLSLFENIGIPAELQPMLQGIRLLLQQEGVDSKKHQSLLLQIAQLIHRVLPDMLPRRVDSSFESRPIIHNEYLPSSQPKDLTLEPFTSKSLPLQETSVDFLERSSNQHSIVQPQKVDFLVEEVDSSPSKREAPKSRPNPVDFNALLIQKKVDLPSKREDFLDRDNTLSEKYLERVDDFSPAQGDFSEQEQAQKSRPSLINDDFNTQESTFSGNTTTQRGDFSQTVDFLTPKKTFQPQRVDFSDLTNVNVKNIINNFLNNVNVKNLQDLAALLGTILEEDRSKWGIYVDHVKHYSQPEALMAALLKTLSCKLQGGTLHNPPAFFLARSKEYHATIPEDAQQLVRQYSALPYGQMLEALKYPPTHSGGSTSSVTNYQKKEIKSSALQAVKVPSLHINLDSSQAGMSWNDAITLYKLLRDDQRMVVCKKFIVPMDEAKTRYALLLDATVSSKVRQTFLYSSQDWLRRSKDMRTCLSLFEPPEALQRSRDRFSALRELLQNKKP
ncbi:hypothetical protein [Ktedonospora formicarum]|uniref:Uncharacterized protein n=1 Tax=Ktedonospora formicarum TaxID=2778364 RepID=A0A8J3I8W7_9CHLR|nr:hypothetical protein [Ktedonospora formicarum]GHO49373.1 hypothetical protein KSX_75360 [Ktedonospora formicarum]